MNINLSVLLNDLKKKYCIVFYYDERYHCFNGFSFYMFKFFFFVDDLNRVILPPSPSRDHSSYINASFIQVKII